MITIDSLKELDSEKVQEIQKGMAEVKEKEREYYNSLAAMVDDMTPNDIYATVQATPRPGTTLSQCAEDLLEELGSEELSEGYLPWDICHGKNSKPTGPENKSTLMNPARLGRWRREIWSLILQDHGPPEGRGNNPRADKNEKDAQGGKEGGRRGEKRKSRSKSRTSLQRQQHRKPAPPSSNPSKLGPFGTTDSRPFRTTKISQGKHL